MNIFNVPPRLFSEEIQRRCNMTKTKKQHKPKVDKRGRLTPSQKREEREFYLAISPWLVGFFLLTIGPILVSFIISFTAWDAMTPPSFVALDNYKMMLSDGQFYSSLRITFKYVLIAVPSSLVFALCLALILNTDMPGRGFFQTIFYFPATVSGVAVFMAWGYLYDPISGPLNYMLSLVGIQGPGWLTSTKWALTAIIIMNLFFCGGQMLIFLAGLKQIPKTYYEAAMLDGASSFQIFWRITLPQLSSVFGFNLIMGIVAGIQVFSQAFAMTAGGPAKSTYFFVFYLYQTAFKFLDFGYGSAMAWSLTLVLMLLALLYVKLSKREETM